LGQVGSRNLDPCGSLWHYATVSGSLLLFINCGNVTLDGSVV